MTHLAKPLVRVINLGRMGFWAANDLQIRYARNHLDELAGKNNAKGQDVVLIVEHSPVYTVGIRSVGHTEVDEIRLKELGAEYYHTNRGGLITFHGPGQIVAYPVLNLARFGRSVKWYIGSLENTLIRTLGSFGLEGRTTKDTGVWVNDRKIAAIGVHARRHVTTHGISLNCNTNLDWYKHIIPCGLEGKEVTSLSQELSRNVTIGEAVPPFLDAFEKEFNCEIEDSLLEEHEHNIVRRKDTEQDLVMDAASLKPC